MSEPETLLLCVITVGVTFLGFRYPDLSDRLLFCPERILAQKEWYRLLSSALVHADWLHVGFNLVALYSFGVVVETVFGSHVLLLLYGASVLGGSLLSLFLHRHHDYSALGASGGVCGVLFASIFMVPGISVRMLYLPVGIPGPIFAALYLVATFAGLRKGMGNIGHDAHFGGAITGLLFALGVAPENCFASPILFLSALLFSGFCLYVLFRDPFGISGEVFATGKFKYLSTQRYQRYDDAESRKAEQYEIDRILDKIAARGIDSLSKRERARLRDQSTRIKNG